MKWSLPDSAEGEQVNTLTIEERLVLTIMNDCQVGVSRFFKPDKPPMHLGTWHFARGFTPALKHTMPRDVLSELEARTVARSWAQHNCRPHSALGVNFADFERWESNEERAAYVARDGITLYWTPLSGLISDAPVDKWSRGALSYSALVSWVEAQ